MRESDLWDGTEESGRLEGSDQVNPPSQPIGPDAMIRQWLRDLSYNEIHAAGVGWASIYTGLLLIAIPGVWSVLGNVLLTVAVGLGVLAAVALKTGRSKALGHYVGLEPHYLLGGLAVGAISGAVSMALIRSVMLVGGIIV